ncbi:MAG: PASTA domain-containing protein, partial [Clostridia bacterium]|nr:PASTA domain-containing protein [Clostridia bacterium]
LLTPHVVKEIVDSEGNIVKNFDRQEVRQVISAETSKQLCGLLEDVVTIGTGKNAYVMGYRVAGKTGTSEKKAKEAATGIKGLRISSFVAFAPADDPQIAVLITLDEPNVYPLTGGITVAPVIRRVMEEVLPYLNVEPVYTEAELQQKDITIPRVTGRTRADAEAALKLNGIKYRAEGDGDTATAQLPAEGSVVSSKTEVVLYLGVDKPQTQVTVPDLSKMSMDTARRTLQNLGLYMNAAGVTTGKGNIVAVRQSIKNEKVTVGTVIEVEFADLDQRAE